MGEMVRVMGLEELAVGAKKVVTVGETEVLLIRLGEGPESGVVAVEAKCPHAGGPLEKGAVCNGRLVCPWHMGEFALPGGGLPVGVLMEPPPMRDLKVYPVHVTEGAISVGQEPLPGRAVAEEDRAEASAGAEEPVPMLLVGLGAAGAMAAVTLRQEGFAGRVVAMDPVADEPVDRTQLTKMALQGKVPLGKTPLPDFGKTTVERVRDEVVELSAAAGTARLKSGQVVRFGSALVATGGRPERLEVPGGERARTIRHTADVAGILAELEGKERVVVVGTSFLAMEAASALVQRGLRVTVVGREEVPFAKKFGEEVGRAVMALHRNKGTEFRLGVEVVRLEEGAVVVRGGNGREESVPADVVIEGVGVTPALGFKHDLPLAEEGKGVRVDGTLRAAGRVWVAGDIANVDGVRIEHWRLAEQHGRVAAKAMLGQEARYEGVPFFWTFHFGKRLGYLGHAEEWDEIVVEGDVAGMEFVTSYVQGGTVKAVLTCGRDAATARLAEVLRGEVGLEEVRRAVAG